MNHMALIVLGIMVVFCLFVALLTADKFKHSKTPYKDESKLESQFKDLYDSHMDELREEQRVAEQRKAYQDARRKNQ